MKHRPCDDRWSCMGGIYPQFLFKVVFSVEWQRLFGQTSIFKFKIYGCFCRYLIPLLNVLLHFQYCRCNLSNLKFVHLISRVIKSCTFIIGLNYYSHSIRRDFTHLRCVRTQTLPSQTISRTLFYLTL